MSLRISLLLLLLEINLLLYDPIDLSLDLSQGPQDISRACGVGSLVLLLFGWTGAPGASGGDQLERLRSPGTGCA